ncbi:crotonase/enoyl-CoA hydratase family protein [Bradyrhizobium brasilense]|uniref:crotonase/enoyl-CoA hydratase family protein n=1 Tax=Bradyrhizobium brasilense TaxID=1419277 RepID=UPI0024B13EBE|nr:crotonase/enoyl-CoA hydratase family protein [Bradyrhizobium australafricanum]WFU31356.1 crotonase/enoyl-CoA hydratase family protein [Bradyrhizobium australafricanum]
MNEVSKRILTERRGPMLIVTFNRPEVKNAVDFESSKAMESAMDILDREDELFVGIITGAGGNFSAGADLKEAAKRSPFPQLARGGFGIMKRPPRKPLIAAVEGYAVGGGFETCLACDLIVAARNAKFGLPEVRHNVLATGGGLFRLPRRIPYHLAMELALTGAFKEAPYFERFGFVNRLAEPGKALEEAIKLAESLLVNGPIALAASKEIVFQSLDNEEDWAKQLPVAQKVLDSEDMREGLRAFAEKREPLWKGR